MNVVERIINIFFKGYYTKETRRKFNDWIISENHQEDKERSLKKLWDTIHVEPTSDTLDSLHSVEKKIGLYKFTSTKLFRIASIAALFLLPIFSLITVVLFNNQNKIHEIEYSEYFTSNGIINEYLLPDSTKIIMNSGSIIVYPQQNTSGQYIVYLNGEAFFEVNERKKNTPFIVKTDGVKIEVMGTRFNVSAYADDPDIVTTLEEGRVSLSFSDSKNANLLLNPNEEIIYNKKQNNVTKKEVKKENIASWKNGDLRFTQTSIHDVLRRFKRKFGVEIYLNSNRYDKEIITAKFIYGETLEDCLVVLKRIVPGLNYRIQGTKIFIY